MSCNSALDAICKSKIIAIVRGVQPQDMDALADALLDGGITCFEFTFDHSGKLSQKEMLGALSDIKERLGDKVTLGVGTVLSEQQVESAARAGAQFILSPDIMPGVIAKTKAVGLVSIPGALTPSEITHAHRYGADIVKLFPAGCLGSGYLKAVRGPLSHIPLSAVGGIDTGNAAEFLDAGAVCLGVGGSLVDLKRIAAQDFGAITAAAKQLVAAVSKSKA